MRAVAIDIGLYSASRRRRAALTLAVAFSFVVAACGSGTSERGRGGAGAPDKGDATTVRLGYFPNLTHATAVLGVETGIFARALGGERLSSQTFNAGPAAVEALLSDALDATYIGPNPAINAFVKSGGQAVRIIAGATSGGASLVVKPGISGVQDLRGKKLASPQLGGTQDVALRWWLKGQGVATDAQGGGDVSILPQENAQTLETFKSGEISGAWVPEPWATRLVQEGDGKVLVDEASLWPDGRFVTTHLVVRNKFLRDHPETVRRLLQGHVEANRFLQTNASEAQRLVNTGIEKVTGKKLSAQVIEGAWRNLEFTNDPVASSLAASADHAHRVGLLDKVRLDGIYDLGPLNAVLGATGEQEVAST